MSKAVYLGLMSGTSLDGVDAVLVEFNGDTLDPRRLHLLGHLQLPMPAALRSELADLNREAGRNELHRAELAGNAVAGLYAEAALALMRQCGLGAAQVRAIGAHGQTVRHRPGEFDGSGYTVQLLNAAMLAERCGIDVVCDFRSRDVAAGGQGAPLVPAFHAALLAQAGMAQAVLNLGGIANLSLLHGDGGIGGFDSGPANGLMDLWIQRHLGSAYDADGQWAAGAQADAGLLACLLSEPYFGRVPPKSTGRDLFNADWLDARLAAFNLPAQVVQATLAELSVRSVCDALRRHLPGAQRLLVCGGGALNGHLMRRLQALLPGLTVASTQAAGIDPMQVEALAFAWLAKARCERVAGNRPEVTGAAGLRILGAIYAGQ